MGEARPGSNLATIEIRENVYGNAAQPAQAPDGLGEQRTSNELVKLIRKLRWMGLEREAERVENQLILRKVPVRTASSQRRARLTNALRGRMDRVKPDPIFEARQLESAPGWYVQISWRYGQVEHVRGFASGVDAQKWIREIEGVASEQEWRKKWRVTWSIRGIET